MAGEESPVVSQVLNKKRYSKSATGHLWSSGISALFAASLYFFVLDRQPYPPTDNVSQIIKYSVWSLIAVALINTSWSFCMYLYTCIVTAKPILLTTEQKRLLGVKDKEPGYMTTHPQLHTSSPTSFSTMTGLPSFSPPRRLEAPRTFLSHHQGSSPSRRSLGTSPLRAGASFSPGSDSQHHMSLNASSRNISTDFNQSFHQKSPVVSTSFLNGTSRQRKNLSMSQSFNADNSIRSMDDLQEMFKEHEASQLNESCEPQPSFIQSFWNFNRGLAEFGPMLRRYAYQVACRSPQTLRVKDSHADEGPAHYEAEEVWEKLQMKSEMADVWIENLRKWLGQTIMVRLVKEIDSINSNLASLGCHEMEIGEASVSTLKQLSITKMQYLPNLGSLIPFLEITPNQQYLVQRIRELGKSSCIVDFKWNSGGDYKGKPWDEHLPTDAELMMHLLCCYMDARLPPNPIHPDGRAFTGSHFIKDPAKPDMEKKDCLCIYQSRLYPPHFKVAIQDDVWNMPKGRNNMFYAILVFLAHVKKHEHGMLGKINLGMSGINILWVLDEH